MSNVHGSASINDVGSGLNEDVEVTTVTDLQQTNIVCRCTWSYPFRELQLTVPFTPIYGRPTAWQLGPTGRCKALIRRVWNVVWDWHM